MKWSMTTAALLTGAFALLTVPGASQSLTDAAAKEKERRAKAKAGKVYTDKELQSAGGAFNSAPSTTDVAVPNSGASPKPAADGTAPPTPEEELAKKQDDWRKRRDKATAEAAASQTEADRIQGLLNDNTKSPYGSGRQAAVAALEEAKAKQATAEQQVTAIEEEGRRNRYR
jgi:hypothetical protein